MPPLSLYFRSHMQWQMSLIATRIADHILGKQIQSNH